MPSRENRAIMASFGVFVLALAGLSILEATLGVPVGDGPLAVFAFAVAIVLPQLYLARTDDEVAPRTRLGVAAVLAGLFVVGFVAAPIGTPSLLLFGIAGIALLVVCRREIRTAYRESIENGDASGDAASRP
ncbi:hypothetical protein QA600_01570 [Natronococcus sp. A-GB1]|uniref:hypothetical protein n=1 Tax=Natronococcus sp. A-GB1 TaxID=3037648 RepID=UPI00241D45BE|nr:hypothetical protein [Natronococcus sp. A-GB1]MDG5758024.1 hypothetical protein [Natronococcus sp. A-GB1]